ncbi:MAG: dipeptide/oligopeptide/nickel ABC transporter ATP-binding protein [Phototrophicales bacterium]|nr:MAG: dipeptide/oligopeptide/nickel ABC transporter ATP-binding protein [Phototrophicales bacterium]
MTNVATGTGAAATGVQIVSEDDVVRVEDLRLSFYTTLGVVRALNGVSFNIPRGKVLGVVGESGCGKSQTGLSIMQLTPGRIEGGRILFREFNTSDVIDITKLEKNGPEMRKIRGNHISMIFQEPMTSLNPCYTVGHQIEEAILLHQTQDKAEARRRAVDILRKVGMPNPERIADSYPHQLSGGMRQRAMIAMALSCNPKLLIADEPTTALDVTIQAQILDLVRRLRDEIGMAMIWITHDLGIVAGLADTVQVMYAGIIVERGPTKEVFKDTRHPYTLGLMKSLPRLDRRGGGGKLNQIEGSPPDMRKPLKGCPFAPRCPYRIDRCDEEIPPLEQAAESAPDHLKACWVDVRTAVPQGVTVNG